MVRLGGAVVMFEKGWVCFCFSFSFIFYRPISIEKRCIKAIQFWV